MSSIAGEIADCNSCDSDKLANTYCQTTREQKDGDVVSFSTMGKVWIALFAVFAVLALTAQVTFFPKQAFSDDVWSDQFMSSWYAHELGILEEPSLLQKANDVSCESYRFLWLRTFHHPIAIRLDLAADSTGILTTKIASGSAGFPRKGARLIESPLLQQQTQAFLQRIEKTNFWELPSYVEDARGEDGSEWIIEGVRKGRYHVVSRWTPRNGEVRELGLAFAFGLAQMNISKDELY